MAVCPAQHPTLSRLSTVEYFSEYLIFNTRASRASIHLHTMKVVTILIPSFHGTPGGMAYCLRKKHEKRKKKKKKKRLHFSSLALLQQARLISRRDWENHGVLADVLSRAVSCPNSFPLPFRTPGKQAIWILELQWLSRDAKKMSVTGAGRLSECKDTEFVWELRKTGFCEGGRK